MLRSSFKRIVESSYGLMSLLLMLFATPISTDFLMILTPGGEAGEARDYLLSSSIESPPVNTAVSVLSSLLRSDAWPISL